MNDFIQCLYNTLLLLIKFILSSLFFSVSQPPKLETMENLMKLSQMLIQGVWESKSTFQMLPHISQENLRHFNTKKVSLAILKEKNVEVQ